MWAAALVLAELFRGPHTTAAIHTYKTYCDSKRISPPGLLQLAPTIVHAMHADADEKALWDTPVPTVRGKITSVLSQCFRSEETRASAAWCRQQLIDGWNEIFMPPNSCNRVAFGKTPWFKVEQRLRPPCKPSVGVTSARLIRLARFRAETAHLKLKIGTRILEKFKRLASTIATKKESKACGKEMNRIKQLLDQVTAEGKQAMQQAVTREQEFAAAKVFVSQLGSRDSPDANLLTQNDEAKNNNQYQFRPERTIFVTYDTSPVVRPKSEDRSQSVPSEVLQMPLLGHDEPDSDNQDASDAEFPRVRCSYSHDNCFAGVLFGICVLLTAGCGTYLIVTNHF